MNEHHKQTLGNRLRHLRIQQGITLEQAAHQAQVHPNTLRGWEQGRHAYQPWRALGLAKALNVPVRELFSDEAALEVVLRPESIEEVRSGGREVAKRKALLVCGQIEERIWQAATQPAVDVSPGARAAKKRRTRAQTLAGVKAANRAILRRREELSRRVV